MLAVFRIPEIPQDIEIRRGDHKPKSSDFFFLIFTQ